MISTSGLSCPWPAMLTFRTIEEIEFQAEGELAQELDGERSSWGGGRREMARVPDHGGAGMSSLQ